MSFVCPKLHSLQRSLFLLLTVVHCSHFRHKKKINKRELGKKPETSIQTLINNNGELFHHFLSLLLAVTFRPIKAQLEEKAVIQQQQLWCVAKNNAEDSALQQALDWACGPGGASCGPIQNGGPCYDPNDLIDMASYAFNDYCLKHGMSDETCNFSNTAALTALDPSHGKCKYASSIFTAANSTTPSTAGVIPGSEDLNGSSQFAATEVRTLALLNLLLAILILSL